MTYLLLFPGLLLFDGFVNDEIHERIVTAQNPRQLAPAVDLKGQFLVHELLELGRMSLRHDEIARRIAKTKKLSSESLIRLNLLGEKQMQIAEMD